VMTGPQGDARCSLRHLALVHLATAHLPTAIPYRRRALF